MNGKLEFALALELAFKFVKRTTSFSSSSVYPFGRPLLDSLSEVLQGKSIFAQFEQFGFKPSHLIFFSLHLSQACAFLTEKSVIALEEL